MPRTGRGGKVSGAAGKAYSNRTDLNVNKALPVEAATGQGYGMATEQKAAQRAMPLMGQNAGMPSAPSAPGAGPMQAPAAAPAPPTLDEAGSGHDAVRLELAKQNVPNAVGGAYSQDPEHLRILQAVQEMANGPFSSSAARDLADFMKLVM